jgi:hypothetical protein
MRDAALQAAGPHDQTHERAEDRALRVGSSGRWSMRPPSEAAYFLLPILRVTRVMRSINSANQPSWYFAELHGSLSRFVVMELK